MQTFGALVDDFEAAYMPRLAMPTQSKYKSLLRVHVRPEFSSMKVTDVSTRKIDEWLAGKAKDGLSWATRSDLRNIVSSIFTRAEHWETYDGKNPACRASPGRKASRYEKRKMSIKDTKRLLAELQPDVRIVSMVALFCGLRISEVLGLCWKHVDFERGMFLVRQRYWRGDVDRTKSEAADRDVPFGHLADLLQKLYPGPAAGERFCFEVRTQRGITRDDRSIRRYFLRPVAEKLGIYYKGFGFHAFRREAITALSGKIGSLQAAKVAGHSRLDALLLYGLNEYEQQRVAIEANQEPFLKAGLLGDKTR